METIIHLAIDIRPDQAGGYFTLPFRVEQKTGRISIRYWYERYIDDNKQGTESSSFTSRVEANIIDLGLLDPDGRQVGASGSDKTEIYVSETESTPGYRPWPLKPGEWRIIVGAYKVAPEGVRVAYEITLNDKVPGTFRGDLHTHTLASDGVLTAVELAQRAARHGLDFLAITDHNQMVSAAELPRVPGVTLIPGVEWTHYQGHANFLGVDCPYDQPFFTSTLEETQSRFASARERGAFIVINHPYEEVCPFRFDLDALPFDCLEIWNGPMRESNLRAVELWQSLLVKGMKISACGGSDYHRDTPFIFLGGPTTCVTALSNSPADILAGLRAGRAYLTFAPNGPTLVLNAGDAGMGDTVDWTTTRELEIQLGGLLAGDVVRVVTGEVAQVLLQAPSSGHFHGGYRMTAPGFARVEVLRAFLPGLPLLPALISNPVFFEM